jgi:FlaA1/EpsC-like NDP-sugar epimerase
MYSVCAGIQYQILILPVHDLKPFWLAFYFINVTVTGWRYSVSHTTPASARPETILISILLYKCNSNKMQVFSITHNSCQYTTWNHFWLISYFINVTVTVCRYSVSHTTPASTRPETILVSILLINVTVTVWRHSISHTSRASEGPGNILIIISFLGWIIFSDSKWYHEPVKLFYTVFAKSTIFFELSG